MHPRVEIGCAEAPQCSDPHGSYLTLAGESLKCFRVDLQQGCRLARIEEPLEMRGRLADWHCFVHLAHKISCSQSRDRAGITASSEGRLWRPASSDRLRAHSLLGWHWS